MFRAMTFAVGALAITAVANADLFYGFDSSNEGWREMDWNSTVNNLQDTGVGANWNPAGYLEEGDFAGWAWLGSPVVGTSQLGAASFSFDYSLDASDGDPFPFAAIVGTTSAIYQTATAIADGEFHTYSYDLTTTNTWEWTDGVTTRAATMADITDVLTNYQYVALDADMLTGPDHTRVDNVRLGAVPEPASLAVLGLGALGLLKRRRNS